MSQTNPGSDAALQSGCTCPVLDNCRGEGAYGTKHLFFINHQCPLHGIKFDRNNPCQTAKHC